MNEDAYAPLAWVAAKLGVQTGTVRNWRYRGWIDETGERRYVRAKRGRYCFADAARAEADTYANSQSRRERIYAA